MGDFTRCLADETADTAHILKPNGIVGHCTMPASGDTAVKIVARGLQTRVWRAVIACKGKPAPRKRPIRSTASGDPGAENCIKFVGENQ